VYAELAIIAAFAFLFSLVAGRLEPTPITGPMVFMFFGLLAGPLGLGWLELDISSQELRTLADLTLALVLFIDAANADTSVLKKNASIPLRMLLIGIPMTIGLGVVVGMLLFDGLGLFELAILATMLTATDAALGKGVFNNKVIPARIREGLNVESGLNDGLCVPVLFVFIALAEAKGLETHGASLILTHMVREIGIGLLVGLSLTAIAAWMIRSCWQRGWITEVWIQLPVIMLAIVCFTVAQTFHGSGYIAAFAGGILFRMLAKKSTHRLVLNAESMAETLAMFTWIVFGAAVFNKAFEFISWQVVVYALLSLTVVRILPIFLSLTGTGEKAETKLFLGWFGPRGFASIVFGIIVLNTELPGAKPMAVVVVCTVMLSAVVHGITANPLASALARRVAKKELPERKMDGTNEAKSRT
jgi:NhaP-type Na+/H+ or K+/H+ antiporter